MRKAITKMLSLIILSLILFNILLGSSVTTFADTREQNQNSELVNLIQADINKSINKKAIKGAIVSIVKDDKTLLCSGYGYADEKNGILADGDNTAFKIGSVSKTFVALSAMKLVEQGKLDMNTPITKYLEKDFPSFKYPITMKNLLTHTAGFETLNSGLFIKSTEKAKQLSYVVKKYRPEQVFKPSEVPAYSNYGLALAGYVVERISGEPFYQYVDDNIFKPLNMNASTFRQNYCKAHYISKGYGTDGKERIEGQVNLYPAGSINTTAKDMAEYMKFMLSTTDNSIIKNITKQELFEKQFAMDKSFSGMGYAWGREEINGHTLYCHEGGTDNFSTVIFLCPDERLGVFVSYNTAYETNSVLEDTLTMLYGKEQNYTKSEINTNKSTIDISGYYQPTSSSFKNSEKFYNITSCIHIKKVDKTKYVLNGKEIISLKSDLYFHPDLGRFKLVNKNGRYYIATSETASFIKLPWYEGTDWQILILLFFIVVTLIGAVITIVLLTKGIIKKEKNKIILCLPGIMLSLATGILITKGIIFFNKFEFSSVENFVTFMKSISLIITFIGVFEIASSTMWIKNKSKFVAVFNIVWSVSFVLLVTWFVQVNLI